MTGPFFPSVDPQTRRLRDQHLPQRLQPADQVETIQDTAGSMMRAVPPLAAPYNDTLGTITISSASGPVGAHCRLHRSGTQTVTAGSVQGITLNTQSALDDAEYFAVTLASGRITVLQPGAYLAHWSARFAAAAAGERYASIAVNGVTNTRFEAGSGSRSDLHTVNGSAPLRLAANDYVNLAVFVTGASVDVQGSATFHTWLSLTRLGA